MQLMSVEIRATSLMVAMAGGVREYALDPDGEAYPHPLDDGAFGPWGDVRAPRSNNNDGIAGPKTRPFRIFPYTPL